MRKTIAALIKDALKEMGVFDMLEVAIEIPADPRHGDYANGVPLSLAKTMGQSPMDIAREIAARIQKGRDIEKIEVAQPGFINFYLSKEFFAENLKKLLKSKNAGKNTNLKGRKIIVEYTDPNPFKEFHIGHLMSNAIGESVSRFYEFQGATVRRACYQGDVGLHVAKAIWGKMQKPELDWGASYAYGAQMYEERKEEINTLNKKIYERSDKKINQLYAQGKKESLARFAVIYKKLGTTFDHLFFESEATPIGKKIVEKNIGNVFEKGEGGAVVFKGGQAGLHTRVFINAQGIPTYEAKDLALPGMKYKYFKHDTSVVITANEQNEYFKVMLAALKKISPELAQKTKHIGHGMMRLQEGKMSSRTGNVITAESLLAEAERMVLEKMKDRNFSEKDKQKVAQQVAVGALKYSILRQRLGGDIIYRPEQAVSFEGDSGPYLQYAYVRALSVLAKAKKEKIKPSLVRIPEIGMLEKMLCRFADVAVAMSVHRMTLYLTELAGTFNSYYAENKIVDRVDEYSPYKVAITQLFSVIMKNGLWLLGIEAPERM